MLEFREHAENTNDIFLVAAQAIANTLIRAATAMPAGTYRSVALLLSVVCCAAYPHCPLAQPA